MRLTICVLIAVAFTASTAGASLVNVDASTNHQVVRSGNTITSDTAPAPADSVLINVDSLDGVAWDFNLASIPDNAIINSATLRFTPVNLTARISPPEHFSVSVYAAASTNVSQPLQSASIGTFNYPAGVAPSPTFVSLSPSAVQALVASSTNNLKVLMFNDLNTLTGGAYSLYAANTGYPPTIAPNPNARPQLSIDFVPEPGSVGLLAAACLLALARRTRIRRPAHG